MNKILISGKGGCNCKNLLKAIDCYISKADEDLEEQLTESGYVDAEDSVKSASDLEDEIAAVLSKQTSDLAKKLQKAGSWNKAKEIINTYFSADSAVGEALTAIFREYYDGTVLTTASSYIKTTAGDMVVSQLRQRTQAWMESWSSELAELMELSSQEQMGTLIQSSIEAGESVADLSRKLIEEGIRNEEWRARRAALTEMLRAHSVAQNEAIMQSPVVGRHKWRHTGTYKSTPRQNHIDMDGQVVAKDKPFTLIGRDGNTYYPMYPRDSNLPAAESINCGCIEEPVVDDEILGMSLEEREALQQQFVEADDAEWEKELDAQNKAKAGIEEDV